MLYIEPCRAPGFITSPRVEEFVRFLEVTGGAPPDACHLLFRHATEELFKKARGAGCAVQARLGPSVLWLPAGHRVVDERSFREQEALGWFYARLMQAGGKLENGTVVFPKGQRGRAFTRGSGVQVVVRMEGGEVYACDVVDLRVRELGRCIRRER